MANKIYVNEIGVTFRVSTGIDLTSASITVLKVKKPSGALVEWATTVYGAATNGVLQHVTTSGDLSESGTYTLQAYVELTDGGKYYGESVTFRVYDTYQ